LETAEEAARAAGRIIRERFDASIGTAGLIEVSFKGRNNIVTDVDHAAEEAVIAVLRREYPQHGIWAEESGRFQRESSFTWIIDPLDGTRNFASGIPHFAVSLALVDGDTPVLGCTYDPMRDELFSAEAGRGTHVNGERVLVAQAEALEQCILGFDLGYVDDKAVWLMDMLRGLWPNMQAFRIVGSAALGYAYVAAGRFHLYAHHHLQPWDVAAGLVLSAEAGGVATTLQGAEPRVESTAIVAASPAIHAKFMAATSETHWRSIL